MEYGSLCVLDGDAVLSHKYALLIYGPLKERSLAEGGPPAFVLDQNAFVHESISGVNPSTPAEVSSLAAGLLKFISQH